MQLSRKMPKGAVLAIGEKEELTAIKIFPELVSQFFTPVTEFVNKHGTYVFRK